MIPNLYNKERKKIEKGKRASTKTALAYAMRDGGVM
jgi:hypothetical protein